MGFISSLSSVLGTREDRRTASCALVDIDDSGSADVSSRIAFQYFPETITDSYSTEWVQKNIIGGSHPIYQWIHGNARSISFEAVFTADAPPKGFDSIGSNPLTGAANAISDIGAVVSQVSKNPLGTAISLVKSAAGGSQVSIDVAGAIAWLKSKLYPDYQDGVALPPPKMLLILPNSGIVSQVTVDTTSAGADVAVDSIPVIMLSCNVTYEAFVRSGSPRVASVALEFAETIQIGTDNWNYVARSDISKIYQPGGTRLYNKTGIIS